MSAFKYKGYDMSGRKIEGEIEALNRDDAERKMGAQAVTIISILPIKEGRGVQQDRKETGPRASLFEPRITEAETAAVLRNLSVMAETGVPFVEALDAVINSARTQKMANLMTGIKEDVIQGKALSRAMRNSRGVFPPIVSDLIRVAEEGGRLDTALMSGAIYMERSVEIRKKVKQALIYPSVMLFVACITVSVLIVWVLPKFGEVFTNMHVEIPATTRFMMTVGKSVQHNPLMSLVALVSLIVGGRYLSQLEVSRTAIRKLAWRAPVVGDLLRQLALARSFQSISTLLQGNVPLIQALENGKKVAQHDGIEKGLDIAMAQVERGGLLSEALRSNSNFPKMLVQMVSIGERTGRLASLLASVAGKMEEDIDAKLKGVVSIVEPVLIVIMGALVGTITVSIITPIYSVIENIK